MGQPFGTMDTRTRLILYGLRYMAENGTDNISLRKIAAECGVSCAAPYKHFEDKDDFIAAIIQYVADKWTEIANGIINEYPDDMRKQLVEISRAYIDFLVKYPYFRSVIMTGFESKNDEIEAQKKISPVSSGIIKEYIKKYNIDEKTCMERMFLIRSMIYGAALMIDNGQLEYNDAVKEMIRNLLNKAVSMEICD